MYIAFVQCIIIIFLNINQALIFLDFRTDRLWNIYVYAIFIEITFEEKYSFIKPTTRSVDRDFFQLVQHLSDAGSSGAVFLRSAQRVACTGCVTCQKMQTSTMVRRGKAVRRPLFVPSFIVFPFLFLFLLLILYSTRYVYMNQRFKQWYWYWRIF